MLAKTITSLSNLFRDPVKDRYEGAIQGLAVANFLVALLVTERANSYEELAEQSPKVMASFFILTAIGFLCGYLREQQAQENAPYPALRR